MRNSTAITRRNGLSLMASALMAALSDASFAAPSGTMTIGVHVSLAPRGSIRARPADTLRPIC